MEPKHYRLKWHSFHKNLLNEFESMQISEELADVTLTCEGINLKAHKFILSACSPYFRTVFKENPCPHPIVILKDVYYVDLIAVINYMYHGEVVVSEDNLSTFMETAVILQVSGLVNTKKPPFINKNKHYQKDRNQSDTPPKKMKKTSAEASGQPIGVDVKIETDNLEEDCLGETVQEIVEPPGSILEAALEVKDKPSGSILERSLIGDVPKTTFIPRKPPEQDHEMQLIRSSSDSSSPLAYERPSELLQQSIKVENEDMYEMIEITSPDDLRPYQMMKNLESQPHHSSQCGNCPHCGKVYSNQSALKYHVRLVHSDLTNMFCCHLCPESFDYREGYKKHMADIHLLRN